MTRTIRFLILFLFTAMGSVVLVGCANTSAKNSKIYSTPSEPVNNINFIYVQNDLSVRGSGNFDVGYADLPKLFEDRSRAIFPINNLSVRFSHYSRTEFDRTERANIEKWVMSNPDAALLTLMVSGGSIISGSNTPRNTLLSFDARLIDQKTKKLLWYGRFNTRFIAPLIGKASFDEASVDDLITEILQKLSADKMILLKDGRVAPPPSAK